MAVNLSGAVPLSDVLPRLARAPVKYLREVAPGVHAYVLTQPMSRVRSYQTNVLSPIGGRGSPQETVLVGHVHTTPAGLVTLVEGFLGAGSDAREWAKWAHEQLVKEGLIAPDGRLKAESATRDCAWSHAL